MAQTQHASYETHAGTTFETWTRIGFAAKGVVYVLIGALALMAALGEGGQTTGSKGAISQLAEGGFGQIALVLVGIGLAGYAAWRIVSSIKDTEGHGSTAKGLVTRSAHFIAGLLYVGTAVYALRLAFGDGGGSAGSNDAAQTWTARLLNEPLGTILIVLIGMAIVVAGIFQMRHGLNEKFRKHLRALPHGHYWVVRAGKWGYVSRGIVFSIIGAFVMIAAIRHDSSEVRGMEGALDTLAAQPYGQILLGVVAAGLACYGVYSVVSARYRKI